MGIPNDPLLEVEEQPNHVLVVMAEPEQLYPMPVVLIEPTVENPIPGPSHEPQPLAATTVKSPTITVSKLTQRRKLKTRRNSNTTQRGIDRVEPEATQNPLLLRQSLLILLMIRPCQILTSMIQT
jgi:hypothetical protein